MWFLPYEKRLLFAIWTTVVSHDRLAEDLRGYFQQHVYAELKTTLAQISWQRRLVAHLLLFCIWISGAFLGGVFWHTKSPQHAMHVVTRVFNSRYFVIRSPLFLIRLMLIHVTFGADEPVYV